MARKKSKSQPKKRPSSYQTRQARKMRIFIIIISVILILSMLLSFVKI